MMAGCVLKEPKVFWWMHGINPVLCRKSDEVGFLRVISVIMVFQIREIRILCTSETDEPFASFCAPMVPD